MARPDPPEYPAPPGHHWEAAEETRPDWRVGGDGRQCSYHGGRFRCQNPAVAALDRGHRRGNVRHESWRYYCADHLYGRWVEGGKLMHWVFVPDAGTE
jgi:hypothetical protein